jgi:CubicO group peptidase (beta-lactamase class C family)
MAAIPSSGGIMTARGLARHYAALAAGAALGGVQLLTPERIRVATEMHTDAVDEFYKQAIKRGLGYRLQEDAGPGGGPRAFGHVGNGMFGYADPDRQFAVAFLRNYAGAAPDIGARVVSAIEAELGQRST